jgi:hypothetical protein
MGNGSALQASTRAHPRLYPLAAFPGGLLREVPKFNLGTFVLELKSPR